jgi:hypothetical protein
MAASAVWRDDTEAPLMKLAEAIRVSKPEPVADRSPPPPLPRQKPKP